MRNTSQRNDSKIEPPFDTVHFSRVAPFVMSQRAVTLNIEVYRKSTNAYDILGIALLF